MKENNVIIEALEFDSIQKRIEDFSLVTNSDQKEIYFIYEDKGWRFRILLLVNNQLQSAFYGELFEGEYESSEKNSPIILAIQNLMGNDVFKIYSLIYEPETGSWPLAKDNISMNTLPLNQATKIESEVEFKSLLEFAENRKKILKKHESNRPELLKHGREYIISRSLGCCEFDGCAQPLFRNERGDYGNFGTLAHIIAASNGGPRAKKHSSSDEIRDPNNFLYLCEAHHRLIDKTDVESYTILRLKKMVEKRKNLSQLLSQQLKYKENIALALTGDILGITTEISDREILEALVDLNIIPKKGEIKRPLKLIDTEGEKSYQIYWANFLNSKKSELDSYKHILRDNSDPLAIFPLGSMPFLFLMGYMTGEGRSIQLFHRSRDRQNWIWPHDEHTQASFVIESINDFEISEEAILILSITADLEDNRIPYDLRNLPIIKITGDRFHQDPFNSYQDFESLKRTIQNAINKVLDDLKIKTLHIMTIAPAISVFAIGQKIQRRNASKIIMYQVDRGKPAYPVLIFEKDEVTSYNDPDINYML